MLTRPYSEAELSCSGRTILTHTAAAPAVDQSKHRAQCVCFAALACSTQHQVACSQQQVDSTCWGAEASDDVSGRGKVLPPRRSSAKQP